MSLFLYTVGHSNDTSEQFINRLKNHNITAICDVRSQPYSRYASWFNRENIQQALKEHDIAYVFLGDRLGARCQDPACKTDGKIDFKKVAATEHFQSGIKRVKKGLRKFNIALMCSEKDPMRCHRTLLIARVFANDRIDIQHILPDNSILQHSKLMQNIVIKQGYDKDLFMSENDKINHAYAIQAHKVGYGA